MEIDITEFFNNADPFEYSASIAERGQNAGKETWNNAKDAGSKDHVMLSTDEQLDALRLYVRDFGAWSKEEISSWSPTECNALFIQLVSGDIREADMCGEETDWAEYERGCEAGRHSSNIFKTEDGTVYYLLYS